MRDNIKKELFGKIMKLYSKQSWLISRENRLFYLLNECDSINEEDLIINLLNNFNFIDSFLLHYFLNDIANFIINDSGFDLTKTQVSSITYDDEADSSQKMLDYIKMPLHSNGWGRVKTVNRFGLIPRNVVNGLCQILIIDEFVGSGQTILGRIKQLNNDVKSDIELKFCFLAGMEEGIKKIKDLGFEVFCPLILNKGISDVYSNNELEQATVAMKKMESKLKSTINEFSLDKYSFGYNSAEALYSLEGVQGNTPNSVFPVFWWPQDSNDKQRHTLLNRYERGLS